MPDQEFRPVPGWPTYKVNRLGLVMTDFGFPLKLRGRRVYLCHKTRTLSIAISELITLVFSSGSGSPAETAPKEPVQTPEASGPDTSGPDEAIHERIAFLRTRWEARIAELEAQYAKDRAAWKRELDALQSRCRKLEEQRDNLAAGRLIAAVA